VILGIGIALLLRDGLGLRGAFAINLCGALALTAWLLLGDLGLPARGVIVLGALAALVLAVGLLEAAAIRRGIHVSSEPVPASREETRERP
jgi:hypothetical protein